MSPRRQPLIIQAVTDLRSLQAVIAALREARNLPSTVYLPLDVFLTVKNEFGGFGQRVGMPSAHIFIIDGTEIDIDWSVVPKEWI